MKDLLLNPRSPLAIAILIVICSQVYLHEYYDAININYSNLIGSKSSYALFFDGYTLSNLIRYVLPIMILLVALPHYLTRIKRVIVKSRSSKFKPIIACLRRFPRRRFLLLFYLYDPYVRRLNRNNITVHQVSRTVYLNIEIIALALTMIYLTIFQKINWFLDLIVIFFFIDILGRAFQSKYFKYLLIRPYMLPIFLIIVASNSGTDLGKKYSNSDYRSKYSEISFYDIRNDTIVTTDSSFTIVVNSKENIILRKHPENRNYYYSKKHIKDLVIGQEIVLQTD